MSSNLKIKVLTYVDDISVEGSVDMADRLICNLQTMEEKKRFNFSNDKSKVRIVGKNKERRSVVGQIKNGAMQESTEYKYLGICFVKNGSANRQI